MKETSFDAQRLVDARVVEVITSTLLIVEVEDKRRIQAVLSPELRHQQLRQSKWIPLNLGMPVLVEMSPYSADRCRIVRITETD